MALDPHYIPAFSIEDVILNKDDGSPLSGGLVYFEQDNNRGVLKPVYQITGVSPNYTYAQLPNPVELSSIGTFEDALANPVIPYFYPYDEEGNPEYYYIRVTSAGGVEQFTREAQPYIAPTGSSAIQSVVTNELSNPQFSDVLFDTSVASYTYTLSAGSNQVLTVAPNWDLVVTVPSSGTVTVKQTKPTGALNIVTNPGTLLNISSTGVTSIILRQRIYGSPNLWGNGYLSASFVGKTYSGTATPVTMYYSQSNGSLSATPQELVNATLPNTGTYQKFFGSKQIPISTSSQTFPNAYVDIYFNLPPSIEIDITSVMVAFTGSVPISNLSYDQMSYDRQIDQLFHYYNPQLEFKPIPSLLTAWDFPLNPAQARGTSMNITTTAAYTWDQTICKSVVGNIAVVRNAVTGGFEATTANADEAFYQMQYLTGEQAKEILGNKLAVNINAWRTQAGGAVTVKVYLFRGSSAATFPTLPTSLGTIAANGDFTLTAANWTLIPRGDLGQAMGTLPTVNTASYATLTTIEDLQFNGWEIVSSSQISNTDKFAIVVTFSAPTTATVITVDSISLVKGDIATRPAPKTANEVLLDCQYYYEKSYNPGILPGATTATGALMASQLGAGTGIDNYVILRTFGINFKTPKVNVTPTVVLYSDVTGDANFVQLWLRNNAASVASLQTAIGDWTAYSLGANGVIYVAATIVPQLTSAGTLLEPEGFITFHYTVDARLGIV